MATEDGLNKKLDELGEAIKKLMADDENKKIYMRLNVSLNAPGEDEAVTAVINLLEAWKDVDEYEIEEVGEIDA